MRSRQTPETGAPARSVWRRGLRYRPSRDRYVYWWKTKHRWAGTCRQFLLKLDDGSLHRAEFRFTRSGWWSSGAADAHNAPALQKALR